MSGAPSTTRRSRAASTRAWTARSVAGIRPHELRGILSQAAYGNVQDLADLFSAMLADHQVRAAVETRLAGVTSARLKVLPATGGDVELNREVAAFASEVFAASHDLARTTTHGLSNIFYGWSVLEHSWRNVGGVFVSTAQHPVYHRDTRFVNAWELEVRAQGSAGSSTATGASTGSSSWVSTAAEPTRWIVMQPTTMGLLPPLSGALHAAVWPWLFRKWATIYQQIGLERFANPLLVGRIKQQATDETREKMAEALADLRGDQAGLIEGEDEIQILEPTRSPADSWGDAIASFDAAIVKAVLGSTLNTEVSAGGGNRATAVSQAAVAIHPRLLADADQWVQRGLVDQWLRPALRFNARLFNYRKPPTPLVILQLTAEAGPQADDLMLRAGALTVDELRESRGWPRWGDARGAEIARDRVVEKQTDAWVRSAGQGDDDASDEDEGRAA